LGELECDPHAYGRRDQKYDEWKERLVSNGAKVALAVGAGYMLGRTRKMRIALMLAAAGITGKFPAMPASLVANGLKSLGASDQLHDLTDQLRGEVLNAAKAATLAAATHRVDALNDRLQGVVPTEQVGQAAGSATRGLTSVTGRGRRGRKDAFEEDEDAYGDEEPLDVEEEDLEDDDVEDEDFEDEDVEDEDVEDEDFEDEDQDLEGDLEDEDADDEDDEPAPPRRRAARKAATPRTSARRSRTTPADRNGEPQKAPSRRGRASAATKRAPVRRGR
jgi:hypothetical protein